MTAEQQNEIAGAIGRAGEVLRNLEKMVSSGDIKTVDEVETAVEDLYREELRDLTDAVRNAQYDAKE